MIVSILFFCSSQCKGSGITVQDVNFTGNLLKCNKQPRRALKTRKLGLYSLHSHAAASAIPHQGRGCIVDFGRVELRTHSLKMKGDIITHRFVLLFCAYRESLLNLVFSVRFQCSFCTLLFMSKIGCATAFCPLWRFSAN